MTGRIASAATVAALALGAPAAAQTPAKAAPKPQAVMTLTAMDYIEMQQLVSRYAWANDTCSNNGYDYADLYTPDGWFTSSRNGNLRVSPHAYNTPEDMKAVLWELGRKRNLLA